MKNYKHLAVLVVLLSMAFTELTAQRMPINTKLKESLRGKTKWEGIYNLNSNAEMHKTMSTDRRIKYDVEYQTYGVSNSWDSSWYQNHGNLYSELDPIELYYYPDYYPISFNGSMKYAGEMSLRYYKTTGTTYQRTDSIHYLYNSDAQVVKAYEQTGNYVTETKLEYNATGQLLAEYVERYSTLGGGGSQYDSSWYSYGANYIISEDNSGYRDSVVFNSSGQLIRVYTNSTDSMVFMYNNGYLSNVKEYVGPQLEFEFTASYNPDYKVYDHISTYYDNGGFDDSYQLKTMGTGGELQKLIFYELDSTGSILEEYHYDVDEDSYGNITSIEFKDSNGTMIYYHHFNYEDVSSIDDRELEFSGVEMYPNPNSTDQIRLSAAERFSTVRVTDISGRIRMEMQINPTWQTAIDISMLEPGSYMLTIADGEGRMSSEPLIKL